MLVEHFLNDPALYALAAAMNEPDESQAGLVRGPEVVIDDEPYVSRREGMEVQRVFDRDLQFATFLSGSCRSPSRLS